MRLILLCFVAIFTSVECAFTDDRPTALCTSDILTFEHDAPGFDSWDYLTLHACSDKSVTIYSIEKFGAEEVTFAPSDVAFPITLQPGESIEMKLVYSPIGVDGLCVGQLHIFSSASDGYTEVLIEASPNKIGTDVDESSSQKSLHILDINNDFITLESSGIDEETLADALVVDIGGNVVDSHVEVLSSSHIRISKPLAAGLYFVSIVQYGRATTIGVIVD